MTSCPKFAIVTIGSGSYLGSTVHDVTLANALRRRGYEVVVYWMLEETPELVADGVAQRMLCHGPRYQFARPSEFMDRVIGRIAFRLPRKLRRAVAQGVPGFVENLMRNLVRSLYCYERTDVALAKRLARFVEADGVTHVKMSFGSIGALALEAQKHARKKFDYLVTFQGDEEFASLAEACGVADVYRRRVDEAVRKARWPALVLSRSYATRLVEDLGLDGSRLEILYCGIDLPSETAAPDFSILTATFPRLRRDLPILAFVGRQESEKGIDLLLYATKMLVARGVRFQLVVCGATAKGLAYRTAIKDIVTHLGLYVHHSGAVSVATRDALFAHCRCVACPSINGEPFGLVVAEAMSFGAPAVVPDYGGVAEVVEGDDEAGGLIFRCWDSGDLARQLERLLTDDALHAELAGNARRLAARFSTSRMVDGFLDHLGLPHRAPAQGGLLETAPEKIDI
ncbi:glycosyltransferase family 4 protein [Methylosinus sp. H3A]|uniref:glycosyltransferase family 4 protein n=1 Tax=Methylosinus sp. H3A TaxID=2785786 RepID=UPI0018C30597|nr:glycosyltransferase family 4 protein [Methylosinus sp. H3A]MBG0810450.1 glycosyltransferase family 4 protein [Methylosinus sp. H3A]